MRDGPRWALGGAFILCLTTAYGGQEGNVETRTEIKVESKEIPFQIEYEVSRTVGAGRIVKSRSGEVGSVQKFYQVTRVGKGLAQKQYLRTETKPAVSALFLIGRAGFGTSRGNFNRGKVLTLSATAYDPSAGRGSRATFHTATGRRATYGVVAVDPRVIPLNTMLYVEGYGLALACDTGGAIKGHRIDLCYDNRTFARRFGRRKVRVHVLKKR